MLIVILFVTMKVKFFRLFSFVLVATQLSVFQHGEKGSCLDVRLKGSVSGYIERFVECYGRNFHVSVISVFILIKHLKPVKKPTVVLK